MKPLPEASHLWDLFSLDPLKGILYWKEDAPVSWGHRRRGRPAGFLISQKRYLYCEIEHTSYSVAGLIWKWLGNGDVPAGLQLDHINRNAFDNRPWNLRLLSPSDNCLNRNIRSDNTTGVAGISIHMDRRRGRCVPRYAVSHRGKYVLSTIDFEKAKAVKARLMKEDAYPPSSSDTDCAKDGQ